MIAAFCDLNLCACGKPQLTLQSRTAQGVKAMSLGTDVRLVGMSVLPSDLQPPDVTSSQESDEEAIDEEPATGGSGSNGADAAADAHLLPCLLLVTQNVHLQIDVP